MTAAAWYFAGLATLPFVVVVLARLFPKRTVDSQCQFCGHTHRLDSWEAAKEYAQAHVMKCDKHPMHAALKRIDELESQLFAHPIRDAGEK